MNVEMKLKLTIGPVDDLLTLIEQQARTARTMLALARNSAVQAQQASPLLDASQHNGNGVAGRVGGVRTQLTPRKQAEAMADTQMQEAANAVGRVLQMAQAIGVQVFGEDAGGVAS